METKVVIVGAGPAGIAAAIQLNRYNIHCTLFEKEMIGGLVKNAQLIENYPGFPRGVTGQQLVEYLKAQIENNKIHFVQESVVSLDHERRKGKFILNTNSHQYKGDIAVVASGTTAVYPDVYETLSPAEKERAYGEVYPLLNTKGKRILVIGAGDVAYDYCLSLAAQNELVVANRSHRIAALPLLQQRVSGVQGITIHDNTCVKRITLTDLDKLSTLLETPKGMLKEDVDYILFATGRSPQKCFYTPALRDSEEELKNQGRLFLAGDVKNGPYRQIAIAAGDGLRVAMQIKQVMETAKDAGYCQN